MISHPIKGFFFAQSGELEEKKKKITGFRFCGFKIYSLIQLSLKLWKKFRRDEGSGDHASLAETAFHEPLRAATLINLCSEIIYMSTLYNYRLSKRIMRSQSALSTSSRPDLAVSSSLAQLLPWVIKPVSPQQFHREPHTPR